MVTVGMYYDVIPGKNEQFEQKFQEVLAVLNQTPGHKQSFLYKRVDDPNSYAIISEWDSEQAFLDFIHSDAFRKTTAWGRESILRNRPRHQVYGRSKDLG